jgi:hypothetical protein
MLYVVMVNSGQPPLKSIAEIAASPQAQAQ